MSVIYATLKIQKVVCCADTHLLLIIIIIIIIGKGLAEDLLRVESSYDTVQN